MNKKILAEMDFASIISEAYAQTQTGAELINKYKSFVMANESTCALVNNFISEASHLTYDNGVNETLNQVADYISNNKTVWALTTVCENINNNGQGYNYLNRNAAKQVEKLLEMEEADVVKYIKAGALKNVMFCESFRNIAKQVFRDMPLVEATADYTVAHPVSLVENVGDGVCFYVGGALYQLSDDKTIQEAQWDQVSNTFRTVTSLLESNLVTKDQHSLKITAGNASYEITEANKVTKHGKEGDIEMTSEQLRDNNRLVLMTANPRFRNQLAGVLEAIALTCESYDKIANMDNVSIYTTKNDRFMVIESGSTLYATLLASNKTSKWTINETAVDAISFIKTKTNVGLGEVYESAMNESLEQVSEEEKEKIAQQLHESEIQKRREKIEMLTERFKNDPVKLAVLSQVAQDLNKVK